MSNLEVLRQIIDGAGYEALDGIKIRWHEGGPVAIRVGLRLNLKFSDGNTHAKRLAFVEVLRSYYDVFRDHLTHWQPNEAVHLNSLREFPLKDDEVIWFGSDVHFSCGFFGYEPDQNVNREPALYAVEGLCKGNLRGDVNSVFHAHIPTSWAVRYGCERIRALMVEWSGILGARHGTAGLSLLVFEPADQFVDRGFFLLKKFPGLDYEDDAIFNAEVGISEHKPLDRIRTINWLTVLDEGIVADLGGRERMRSELGPDCPLFDYAGGTVIQAGPEPVLGSYEDDDFPEAYRKVARLTRPVRFEAYRWGLFNSLEPPLDDLDETLSWIRRFD